MPFYEGGDFQAWLDEFPNKLQNIDNIKYNYEDISKQIKKILLDIMLGLDYIHKENLVHGDIKPGNIFLSKTYDHAVIGDFDTIRGTNATVTMHVGKSKCLY